METTKLKKFAQYARRSLMEQVRVKLDAALAENSPARREKPKAVAELEAAVQESGREQVIERAAYTWFNRFCALRFMDVNDYPPINVVSPADPGQFQPEILAEAKDGQIDEDVASEAIRQQVFALLGGKVPSNDPQGEAYRLLMVAACNAWHRAMPFLFQRIDDYTELLLPDDLLSGNSILAYTREAMTPDACKDVEVIGWLYQFYISEKKDEVFAGLKKNKKITPENIPAATQLFTPHWIVRYLVENSLGRLWLLNRPESKLIEQMEYYIRPEQQETDFLRVESPEEIRICDPACGSGHMLTYAFDLLYAIYEEEGYDPAEIPEKILTQNLYGIEIDERAGELAAFALTMKASARQRRFFSKGIRPNICVLKNIRFEGDKLKQYMDFVGRDLFTLPLQGLLRQFEEADNFGSLIRPMVTDVAGMLRILEAKDVSGQLFLHETHEKVVQALRQADYLSPKYHVVIANPPYVDLGNMNQQTKDFLECNYEETKQNLDICFLKKCIELSIKNGYTSMITQRSWMFLSRIEEFRYNILENNTLTSMIYLGTGAFPEIAGEKVQNTTFVFKNGKDDNFITSFYKLTSEKGESKEKAFLERNNQFYSSVNRLHIIPGFPLAFWASDTLCEAFGKGKKLSDISEIRVGLDTGDNAKFIRIWYETSISKICFIADSFKNFKSRGSKWAPHSKGGPYRKWYGNIIETLAFDEKNYNILANQGNKLPSRQFYFKKGIFYSRISSEKISLRVSPIGVIFNSASPTVFPEESFESTVFAVLNSKVISNILECLSPTLNFQAGELRKIPLPLSSVEYKLKKPVDKLISLAQVDWDSYETSWDFTRLPLLLPDYRHPPLKATYRTLRAHWHTMTQEMQRLEEENNRIFIDAYGLQDELTPDVPLNEITLTCNPHYRYGGDKTEEELEALLLADTMRELVSYAVGCMFGRYSLDIPGLVLANQGDTLEQYSLRHNEELGWGISTAPDANPEELLEAAAKHCSFPPNWDNVIPMLDGDWFTDDIAEGFKQFLKVSFGTEHYEENLRFVEQSLNIKGKRNYTIRDYFLGEFYADHVKRYKKRPIYWLFSSPKGSFNALIYLHRYRPDTASIVLNNYLREFRAKLEARKNHLEAVSISADSSQGEKTKAIKEIEKIRKTLAELDEYERETLYPLATKQLAIDLDDGVKANYPKFGAALKKIAGLEAVED